jgi:hypothetical protein
MARYYYYYEWLREHIAEVDRVLHSDTFDVIFQSDPFVPSLNSSKLYFTFEPVTIGESRWTARWITECYSHKFLEAHGAQPTSCSGVTAGGAKPFLTYLGVLLNQDSWRNCFGHSLDQAHHNYLLHTGEFARAGLEIEAFDCNSRFLTMHFCCKRAKCRWDPSGIIFGNNSREPPLLVHQYNRWKNLTRRNPTFCPQQMFKDTEIWPMAELRALGPIEFELPTAEKIFNPQ